MPTLYTIISTVGMARIPKGGQAYLNTLDLCLWVNNYVPVYSDPLSKFTEASYTGYARQPTTGWGVPIPNAQPPNTDMADVQHSFSPTAPILAVTVYGAFLLDPADGSWIAAQPTNVAPPFQLSGRATVYQYTPRLTAAPYAAYP